MVYARFYKIKDEIRILGIDDGPFERNDRDVLIVGTVFRGGSFLDGVLSTKVRVDGLNSTSKLMRMISACRFKDLRVIMLDGIGFGGFNIVDIEALNEKTGLPVIVIVRRKPNLDNISAALDNIKQKSRRLKYITKAGTLHRVQTKPSKFIYIQTSGIRVKDAEQIVRLSSTRSIIPEPIRVAHLIASGIIKGQSKGSA